MKLMLAAGFIGGWELVLILVVVLVLFGAKKLPELAKGLGQGIKEFKKATREVSDELHNAMEETPKSPTKTYADPTQSASANPSGTSSEPAVHTGPETKVI
jgi:sec-independent protein translocase protein TatA